MSLFNHLPDVLIDRIFKYSTCDAADDMGQWRSLLPLLAVCSSWRAIGRKFVYGNVFIAGNTCNGSGFNYANKSSYSAKTSGETNIGLVKLTGNTMMVRSVEIKLHYRTYFNSFIRDYKSIFDFEITDWSRVSSLLLNVNFLDGLDRSEMRSQLSKQQKQEIERLADTLVRGMPNVVHMDIQTNDYNPECVFIFGKCILDRYSNQLKTFSSDSNRMTNIYNSITAKTCFTIDMDDDNTKVQLYNISASTVKTLKLMDVPVNFDLRVFGRSNGPQDIVFSSLRNLEVNFRYPSEFGDEMDVVDSPKTPIATSHTTTKVFFPVLKTLNFDANSLQAIHQFLCSDIYDWSNVTCLRISGLVSIFSDEAGRDHISRDMDIVTKDITKRIPRLTELRILAAQNSKFENVFASKLANRYLHQLTHLMSSYLIRISPQSKLQQLTHLSLNYSIENAQYLPMVCCQSLINLRLRNVPASFSWKVFLDNSESTELEFTNLKEVMISFRRAIFNLQKDVNYVIEYNHQKNDNSRVNISFPKLRSIDVNFVTQRGLFSVLDFGNNMCESATALTLVQEGTSNNNIIDSGTIAQFSTAISRFSKRIFKMLPNITSLTCDIHRYHGIENAFYSTLYSLYSGQLIHARCDEVLKLDNARFRRDIKLLDLMFEKTKSEKSSSNGLREAFNIDSDVNEMTLCNLKSITLNQNHNSIRSPGNQMDIDEPIMIPNSKLQINLPRINNINISTDENNYNLNNVGLKFVTLSTALIKGRASCLPNWITKGGQISSNLMINVTCAKAEDEQYFYECTNSWFQTGRFVNAGKLYLWNIDFNLNVEKLNWSNVTLLKLGFRIDFDTVVKLIRSLDRLDILNISCITGTSESNVIREYIDFKQNSIDVPVLSLSVSQLEISKVLELNSMASALVGFEYLRFALPSLTTCSFPS